MIYFSQGNHKLSKNILVWNLPRGITCPGAGECLKWCYEVKSKRYSQVEPRRRKNLLSSKRADFVDNIARALQKHKQSTIRVHSSGDFYDNAYLQKWYTIARKCPNKAFFAFTKSLHLPLWTNKPENFNIIQSYHSKWDHLIDPTKATARIIKPDEYLRQEEILCLFNRGLVAKCGEGCRLCIEQPNIHIVFPKH